MRGKGRLSGVARIVPSVGNDDDDDETDDDDASSVVGGGPCEWRGRGWEASPPEGRGGGGGIGTDWVAE